MMKLQKKPWNWDSTPNHHLIAMGFPRRTLNPYYPSKRRYKKALGKYERRDLPTGSYERAVHREIYRDEMEYADRMMGDYCR